MPRTERKRKNPAARLLSWVGGALTSNLGLKLTCLSCAFVLVAYQRSGEELKTRSVAYKVDVQLPPESLDRALMTTLPPSIKVTVEGNSRTLDELTNAQTTLDLDLRLGQREQIHFAAADIDVPPGIKVKLIEPSTVRLKWQDIISREVPIQASVTGAVAGGYEVSYPTVTPDSITLRGPATLVNVTQFVRVAPIDVTGLSQAATALLALDQAPQRTRYVGSPNVTVGVMVTRKLTSTKFSRMPVEVVGLPGARTIPAEVNITLTAPPEVVSGLGRELIMPRVDLNELEPLKHGSRMLPVVVDITGAKIEVQPPKVKVTW